MDEFEIVPMKRGGKAEKHIEIRKGESGENVFTMPAGAFLSRKCVRCRSANADVEIYYFPFEHVALCVQYVPDSVIEVYMCKECYYLLNREIDRPLSGIDWWEVSGDIVDIIEGNSYSEDEDGSLASAIAEHYRNYPR